MILSLRGLFLAAVLLLYALDSSLSLASSRTMNRKAFLGRLATMTTFLACCLPPATALASFQQPLKSPSVIASTTGGAAKTATTVAYKQLSLPMTDFPGVQVPIALWFPVDQDTSTGMDTNTSSKPASYQHRISVRRIGQLLAGWEFIPEFVSKGYTIAPAASASVVCMDGSGIQLPAKSPVVLLAHGYLGSRFDLSHLAEELASQGFTCLAAEYPESLAASYDRLPGLDRRYINDVLLNTMQNDWNIQASSYGIVGHSLGCGTVLDTGDEKWARVSIAGFPRKRDGTPIPGNGLFLTSMGDGAVSLARYGGPQLISECGYEMLEERAVLEKLPKRAALVIDRPDAPNHISFLSEGVNDAMIDFLSPLLPVAQAMSIPVLDFDRYKLSRDSKATAEILHPLIVQYLKQEMQSSP